MIENSNFNPCPKPPMSPFRFLVFLVVAPWTTWAAEPVQDMQYLRQLGNTWLEQQATLAWPGVRARAQTGAVDERLRLAACRDLQFSLPASAHLGNSGSLNVQCAAPLRWSLYLGFQLRLSGPAWIAQRYLPARTILGSADLEARNINYERPPTDYLSSEHLPVGARSNRPILAGQPVLAEWLSRPPTINAGQRVRIVVRGAGFSVNQEGSALGAATAGEAVRVKIHSGRIMQGIAQDDGSVLVRP